MINFVPHKVLIKLISSTTSSNRQDYLKAILSFELRGTKASTSAISDRLSTRPASVTGMFRVLADSDLIEYIPYQGAKLTIKGRNEAVSLLRKHRLWETFMVEKLGFSWDEVHEVAEQLEHVDSLKLISKLDAYLGFPRFDPHGDPIPDSKGVFSDRSTLVGVCEIAIGKTASIRGVLSSSDSFLKHLDDLGIKLGLVFTVVKVFEYDGSLQVSVSGKEVVWSKKLVEQLLAEVK
ncbi:MAG: metal-dependent transcriptional regulator [Bacteroidetes bacterium]|nr:metal-dependent transcriptional regulator [Bacteroidota bacterium]